MPIDVTAAGAAGTHTFAKVNVNLDEDFIYFKNTAPNVIPAALAPGVAFLYTSGVGSVTGFTENGLVYVTTAEPKKLKFSTTSGGAAINFTDSMAGSIKFNTPIVYANKLNLDASTPTNQAVKYFTNGEPLTGLTSGDTYFLKNVSISEFAGSQSLYPFSSHTFTTCGLTGRTGPTQTQMRTSYSTTWDDTYISQGAFVGYQDWTVPVSGIYRFNVRGAAGYDGTGSGTPGRGAIVEADIALTKGEVITIIVGQRGAAPSSGTLWGGGGGGTYVVRKTGNEPLFVAGGGSGESNTGPGRDGVLTKLGGTSTNNQPAGGTSGFGGRATNPNGYSAAGGGFFSRGQNGFTFGGVPAALGGGSFLDGLTMGTNTLVGGYGGFGGGGQADGNRVGQSGGGGGYSGGGGARSTTANQSGGGGGSFIATTSTNVKTSTGFFDGANSFNGSLIQNLASYNTAEGQVAVTLISSFTTGNTIHPTAQDAENGTNAIAVEPAGSSYHSFVPINFDVQNDQIHSAAPHTLTNGEAVQVSFNATPPTGIQNNGIYYINTVNAFTYRLSTTPSPSFTNINLISPSSREVATTAKLSRVVVNTATDTLTINNHGFLVDQPLRYQVGDGTAIAPLIDQATYYVAEVLNANQIRLKSSLNSPTYINFTSAGTGTGHSFIFLTVNALEDTLYIPNHGLVSGQAIRYSKGLVGNTVIPGLTDNFTYYIVKVDNSIVRLATNKALTVIANITNQEPWPATGTHSLFITSLDYATETITLPSHGFLQGELVEYDTKGQAAVNGLTTATPYYVIFVDGDNIKLATTPENADAGTAVNLTDTPIGVGRHTLRSLSKTPDGIYTITSTPSPQTFTVEAAGNVPIITKVFNPRGAVDLELNTFFIPSHGFTTGTEVTYEQGDDATDIGGITNNTQYYVVAINRDYLRLSTSNENAAAGITLNITDWGTGVGHKLITDQINGNVTGSGTVSVVSGSVLVNGTGTAFSKILKVGDRFRLFPPNTTKQHGTLVFAAGDVNASTNLITKSHTFTTGTQVVFSAGGGSAPAPLVEGATYFVRAVTAGATISLHPTSTDATNNTNIVDITTTGTGSNFQLAAVIKTFADADVNTTNNRIVKTHNFATGDVVKFATNGGVAPTPLVDGYYYYVRAVSNTEITLHTTLNDANNNLQAIDFSTQGTGTGFTLTNTIPVGPIIRKITAIGSDTQITVDRPYANAYSAVSYSYPTFVYVRPQGYSLHRPFDGGVEMSVGSKTSFGQIVRQTRKYFRYQSGKGIQSSCGVNFQPSIDLESMVQFSSLQVECKTRRPHGLVSGLFIAVNGAEDSYGNTSTVYNGEFQVTVVNLTTFRFTASQPIVENRAYGFPQFYVREWENGAVREGMFDFQNGAFFEFDGEAIYCVRRSSTQQLAGTASALQGSELIFGNNTAFQAQLAVGDYIVMRGQSYRIAEIESDTRMAVRPEYKGSSGTEKEFNPQTQVNTTTDIISIIGHGFSNRLPVVYNSIDGEPIGGMINGRTYYIDLINNNTFKLLADPDATVNVDLSSTGTTTVHSFVPAKSGIVMTKTVDTRVPQSQWNIDICDGSGPTGYNLDISRIQMAYIDYSWYGAGKIRFGFKTVDGQVQYVHEFVHNNNLFESYFRSGNLPGRYEVVTYENPTYIPYLFHWGTSVIMDGRFDDDNAYLFTGSSQTLNVPGTTAKSFASSGINLTTDLFTVQSHGFSTGDTLQFQSIATNGFPGTNSLNPATQIIGSNTRANLTNDSLYGVLVNSPNFIHLTPPNVTISRGTGYAINPQTIQSAQTGTTVTITTTQPHGLTTGMYAGIYGSSRVPNGPFYVTRTSDTVFTYTATNVATPVTAANDPNIIISEVINFTSQGNTQYTYFLYPNGSLNNTSGPNYQPLLSIRLSPSVSEGLTGKLGDRDVLNRMQLRLQEIGVSTTQLVDVKVLLNPRLNNLNFVGVDSPSLTQIVEHTAQDTVSGGVQVYNFRAAGGAAGAEDTTVVDVSTLFELSNSILGGDSIFPDGPDILTIAVSRLTGSSTLTSAKMSWAEAQA
jgi:hypothetical protein